MSTRKHFFTGVWLLIGSLLASPLLAASLDPALLPQVQAATFEVVMAKPDESSITYEKPLPLDELPFQFRNDKYYSIGTAFALGDGHYVTAFHVLGAGISSLLGAPALRDAAGHVYAIDKITRFSLQEDFMEFTLVDGPKVKPLEVDRTPAMNDVVYAVGNALGTGVVIRDGLYTSDTPEDENGRWKWMRFSAAASPGNSGGPLLDKNGKVIGIVLMKSPSENLNYALPIYRVLDASTTSSQLDKRSGYALPFLGANVATSFRGSISLPRTYADFVAEYLRQYDTLIDQEARALLAKNADNIFPRGAGSQQLMTSSPINSADPSIIRRTSTGQWKAERPKYAKDSLPDNGYVMHGVAGENAFFHLRRPDSVSPTALYGDAKLFEDLLLKGSSLTRQVGQDKIRIVSLGKPLEDTSYVDAYRRTWKLRTFGLPYSNVVYMVLALPVPDGYVAIARYVPAAMRYRTATELKTLSDFISMNYEGSFAQWKAFLASGVTLPDTLRAMKLSVDYGKRFSLATPAISLDYGTDLQAIDAEGRLDLAFAYIPSGDTVSWQIRSVEAKSDDEGHSIFRVNYHPRPSDDAEQAVHERWEHMLAREHPEDDVPYSNKDRMEVGTIAGDPAKTSAAAKPDHVYTVFYSVDETTQPADAMKAKLALVMKGLTVDGR